MEKNVGLVKGPIFKNLVKLAIPIMGTSFVQMAYSMTDMIWVGRLGSKAVAAVGTAGFFTWLAQAFIIIPKIGAEVGIAQSVGKEDMDEAKSYLRHSIQLIIFFSLLYGLGLILFRKPLIGFFNLNEPIIVSKAINYLVIISIGMAFFCINPIFSAIFNGYGDSKTPFKINSLGLIINMILDPIFIFLFHWGVEGAALATIIAQITVTMVFIFKAAKKAEIFRGVKLFKSPDMQHVKRIVRLGIPVGMQSGLFTVIAMILARIIARWGDIPIAVQNVGSQIEAISWLTAGGFQTALSTFVGQNYGAKKWDRVYKGYFAGIGLVSIVGIFTSCLLIFAAKPIFSIFIHEKEAITYGIGYLRILGLSQLFMCIEITTSGAFNGLGKTVPPAIVSIVFNALRIPGALILSSTSLGLNGIWWSISISSILKGIISISWFIISLKRNPNTSKMSIFKLNYLRTDKA